MINVIYNEDCIDTMQRMPEQFIDMIITSPPYDDLRSYNNTPWNFKIFKSIANNLHRILKDNRVIIWITNDATINGSETGSSFRQALYFKEIGLNIHDTMIYRKLNPVPNAKVRYQQCFEYMFVFSKGKPKTINLLTRPRRNKCNDKRIYRLKNFNRNQEGIFSKKEYFVKKFVPKENIFEYYVGGGNSTDDKIAYEHPAIFPEKLAEDQILTWSNEKDIIYDPFMGSGTVAKVCLKLNRYYIGSEIVEKYYKIAQRRING